MEEKYWGDGRKIKREWRERLAFITRKMVMNQCHSKS
jgi:hypothetical protein